MAAKKSQNELRDEALLLYRDLDFLVSKEQSLLESGNWKKVIPLLREKQKVMYKINMIDAKLRKMEFSNYKVLELEDVIRCIVEKQRINEEMFNPFIGELKSEFGLFNKQKKMQKLFATKNKNDSYSFSAKF